MVAYASNTASGDATRPNFILNQMTQASADLFADHRPRQRGAPYSGTLTQYMSQVVSQQAQAATAATNLQQGQDTVVSALQQRFNDQSGVSIDTEMSNLIALQNAYGANARVMSTIQQMMTTLLQVVIVMSITGPGSITALNIQAVNSMNNQLNTLSTELGTNAGGADLFGSRLASRRGAGAQRATCRRSTAIATPPRPSGRR